MTLPQHCPGFEQYKSLTSFICKCSTCGKEIEIFSDEFDKKYKCNGCKQEVDLTKCKLSAHGEDTSPR